MIALRRIDEVARDVVMQSAVGADDDRCVAAQADDREYLAVARAPPIKDRGESYASG